MGVLVLALYAEGPSDARFLPPLIQRTAKNIIDQYRQDIDVSEPIVISIKRQNKREDCILSFRMCLPLLCFRRTLEALKGIVYASCECFRAKSFEKPTPPAWGEDEFSAILDAASGCINGSAGDVWFHLYAQWE